MDTTEYIEYLENVIKNVELNTHGEDGFIMELISARCKDALVKIAEQNVSPTPWWKLIVRSIYCNHQWSRMIHPSKSYELCLKCDTTRKFKHSPVVTE